MDSNATNVTAAVNDGMNYSQILSLITYIAVFLLGTIGNGLVIYVTGYKMKTTVNSIWFLNLALADFLFTFFLILSIANVSRKYDWPFGLFMCKFNTLVSVLNMFASIFILTAISLDRCLSTWVIVWAQNKRTPVKARIACLIIWVLAIACSIPFATYRTLVSYGGNVTFCTSKASDEVIMDLAVFRFMIGFLVPFIIIICSYVAIAVRAQRLQRQKKIRPFRLILTVILAFFVCWFPFHIHYFITISKMQNWSTEAKNAVRTAGPFIVSLAYLNSCLNPILYVFMCEEFKNKLKQSLFLVLEGAFAEEHLGFLTPRHSVSSRHSETQMKRNGTTSSLVSRLDRTSSED